MNAVRLFSGTTPLAAIDPADRGLAYGDGLFETMRCRDGALRGWPRHHARLAGGARRLGLALPPGEWLHARLRELAADGPADAVLKLQVTRGPGGRGYAPTDAPPTLVLSRHAPPPPAPADGLVLRWCETRLAIQPALAGIKHLNRLEQVLARAEWSDPGIHEGLMRDADGRVACAVAANVCARIGGRWLTPPVHRCGVAGTVRGWLLSNGLVQEADLWPADVEAAEALFLCNAVRGILPVRRLGDRHWPADRDTDARLAALAARAPPFGEEE